MALLCWRLRQTTQNFDFSMSSFHTVGFGWAKGPKVSFQLSPREKKHWYFVGILSVKGHFHSVPSDGFFYFLCTSDPGPSHSSYIWPGPRYSSHRATCRSTNPHNKNYIGLEIKYKRYEQFNTVFSRLGLPK